MAKQTAQDAMDQPQVPYDKDGIRYIIETDTPPEDQPIPEPPEGAVVEYADE